MSRCFFTCIAIVTFTFNSFDTSAQKETFKVAVFIYQNAEILDFTGPIEVFAATEGFQVYTVSLDEKIVSTRPDGVIKILPEYTLDNAPTPDIVIVPGGNSADPSARNDKVYNWIKKNAVAGSFIMTVCSGANLVAYTDLLNGLNISTNYQIIDRMKETFPKINVMSEIRFVDSGNILTTAGVSAGIDGALHLVRRIKGIEVAKATARYMEYDKWIPEDGRIDYINPNIARIRDGQELILSAPIPYEGELINEAKRLMDQNRMLEASRLLQKSVEWYPNSFISFTLLGKSYKVLGKESPMDEESFLKLIREKEFKSAETELKNAQNKFPGWMIVSEQNIYDVSHAFINSGDFNSGERLSRIYTQLFPKSWYSFDTLAKVYERIGNYNEAIINYRKVLILDPDNDAALQALSKLETGGR